MAELGAAAPSGRLPASRLVFVDRAPGGEAIIERPRDGEWAAAQAAELLHAQRVRFAAATGAGWAARLAEAAGEEAEVLRGWLDRVPVTQLTLPRAWGAAEAVAALAARLGTER
jgi:hypothetical protein